jgi:glycosyltransferase involved in cell wall biosynthesis/ABC-type Na+ transport system ATPase subunit NatA
MAPFAGAEKSAVCWKSGTGFHQELTGRENIFISGYMLGMKKSDIKKNFDEIVQFSGIGAFLDTPVKRYSSGMYVRLAFAVAAHLEPDILIVDEVLAVGDAEFQKKCMGKMKDVSTQKGRTIIFVSHNMQAVNSLCSKAIWLQRGTVLDNGEAKAVVNNYMSQLQRKLWKQQWHRQDAPGNESIKVLSIEMIPHLEDPMLPVDIRTPITVRFRFLNTQNGINLMTGLHLFTLTGECIFDVCCAPVRIRCRHPGRRMHHSRKFFKRRLLLFLHHFRARQLAAIVLPGRMPVFRCGGLPRGPELVRQMDGVCASAVSVYPFAGKNAGALSGRCAVAFMNPSTHIPPLVSVVIPCYNHGAFLAEAIESIQAQTYPHIEILVVDDGSTDNTKEVACGFEKVRYIHQPNAGLSAARNTGIKASTGAYILFSDADDWLMPNAVETNMVLLQQRPDAAFVSGGHKKVNRWKQTLEEEPFPVEQDHFQRMLQGNYIGMHGTVLYQRWAFENVQYDTTLKACEDYDVYLNLSREHPVLHHTKTIAAYRFHSQNMSGNIPLMLDTVLDVLRRQQPFLRTREEQVAFNKGLQNWSEYYTGKLFQKLMQERAQESSPTFQMPMRPAGKKNRPF